MEKILMIVICALSSFITSTYCCLLSGSGGSCLTSGISFGGRIHFPDGPPDYLTDKSGCPRQRIFIFKIPRNKGRTIRSMFRHSGVGRIWMSNGITCRKPTRDGDLQCPATENQSRPCLDENIPCSLGMTTPCTTFNETENPRPNIPDNLPQTVTGYRVEYKKVVDILWKTEDFLGTESRPLKGPFEAGYLYEMWITFKYGTDYGERELYETFFVKCRDINLKLQLSTISQRSGMSSVVAHWTVDELTGPCSVDSQTFSVKQFDTDNCAALHDPIPVTKSLPSKGDRSYRLRKMKPNIVYNVSVTVNTELESYTAWQVIRTQGTVPSAHPSNVTVQSNKRFSYLDIRWDKLPCEYRHGTMKYYSVKMTREGVTRVHNVKGTRARYAGFSIGDEIAVQVAAINSYGMGPYCPVVSGTFGTDGLI